MKRYTVTFTTKDGQKLTGQGLAGSPEEAEALAFFKAISRYSNLEIEEAETREG